MIDSMRLKCKTMQLSDSMFRTILDGLKLFHARGADFKHHSDGNWPSDSATFTV